MVAKSNIHVAKKRSPGGFSNRVLGLFSCAVAGGLMPGGGACFEIPELVFARLGEIEKSQPGPSRWRLSPNPHGESCSLKARTQAAGSATFGSVRDRHASFRAPSGARLWRLVIFDGPATQRLFGGGTRIRKDARSRRVSMRSRRIAEQWARSPA